MNRNRARAAGVTLAAWMLAAGSPLPAQQISVNHQVVMTVVGVSMLALNDESPVSLTLRVPAGGASPPVGETDASKRLFYTVVTGAGRSQCIQVRLDGSVPPGTALTVEAVAGEPGIGKPAARSLTLSATDQTLVTGIGSCATGRTGAGGMALLYSLVAVDRKRLVIDSTASARVVYTITGE